MWWIREWLKLNKAHRPRLITMSTCRNIELSGLFITNSPSFHIVPDHVENVYMHDFEIYVDSWGQLELSRLFSKQSLMTPMFDEAIGFAGIELPTNALNTDGIDIAGRNATFRRIKITNWDDAIVPKPSHQGHPFTNCTQDILVEDIEVTYGVGMSIGSVPPNSEVNCVKDVIFRNVNFNMPMKGIYIKTNPGTGSGVIRNITYENIVMHYPVWWGVYIGPQQMKEPGGDGPGCLLYPLTACETQPLVTISDITLRNVTSYGSILPAGILRCNASNPCKNFVFEDVVLKSPVWDALGYGFISEYIEGTVTNSFPDPGFKPVGYFDDPANLAATPRDYQNLFAQEDFMYNYLKHIMKNRDPIKIITEMMLSNYSIKTIAETILSN